MLLTFPEHNRPRQHLILKQSMRAWSECLPAAGAEWLATDCGRVLLRSMALDWFCDNGRSGREWLYALGLGLGTWRKATGDTDALITLPESSWAMGTLNGFPRITPNTHIEDEDPEAPVVRLGMKHWENAVSRIPIRNIDEVAKQSRRTAGDEAIDRVIDQKLELEVPACMAISSVALMGIAVMEVVGIHQLAIVGGDRRHPWHGYLGQDPGVRAGKA